MVTLKGLCAAAFPILVALAPPLRADEPAAAAPVVVELFTSQGCNTCPPADAYLGELTRRAGVLPLAFHVDYWNYIGWTDPFSRPWSSERQRGYMKSLRQPYVYTPQIVVDGAAQAIGSERGAVDALIRAAAAKPSAHPSLALRWREDGALVVDVGAADPANIIPPPSDAAVLWLIGFARPQSTDVLRGENQGKTLTNYDAVRTYRRLGAWIGWAEEFVVPANQTATLGDGGAVVLLQAPEIGPILTAAEIAAR